MEITRDTMEQALMYLARTDEDYARARAYRDGLEDQKKVILASVFMRANGNSAAANKEIAYNSMEYRQHLERWEQANLEYLTLQAKRQTAELQIDCWRSLNAARNRQQVV